MEDTIVSLIIIALMIMLFAVLGIIFIKGKGASLIAGYNTKTAEEKNQYDTVALCKFIGKMMFALSFSMLFWILSLVYEIIELFVFGLVLFIGIVVFTILYVNTGRRFKK
ncbi:DUF3784 domain-containing protein [Amphibacillus sediminis]|uniref:DUF3784 domain-containing protein n=1 Tax=Amphibacillus sediminis TaxID=360185 RepID=UPI00082A81AB|nr:DUF3784 domain-containing protein [Amphibacillus sediminis]